MFPPSNLVSKQIMKRNVYTIYFTQASKTGLSYLYDTKCLQGISIPTYYEWQHFRSNDTTINSYLKDLNTCTFIPLNFFHLKIYEHRLRMQHHGIIFTQNYKAQ